MSGMELVAAPIVSVAVEETGRPLCRSIYSMIKNIVKGPVQQLDLLESHMKSLMVRRNDAAKEMEFAKREGRVIKGQANAWVGEVDELKRKCDQIQKAKSSRCFLSCITKRYRISTKVAEHLKEIERLLEGGSSLAGSVAFNYSEVKEVEHIPGPSIQDQTASVSEDLAKIMALLSEDKKGIIGIWGMGGVGKTNLVRNLNNKLLENNSNLRFSCVIWVTVSKILDIKKLQKEIAFRLSFHLEESSGDRRMAIQLHQRLKKESFLLILDDVWEEIDLNNLGVPRPEDHSGGKIILTSRSLDVCRAMRTDHEVKMSVLRDEDAWQLFSRYARDVVSSDQIKPLAEAICRECEGLPLAIITVAAAMRGKTNPEVWKHALNQLRRSVPCAASVEEKVYKHLKWSYDSLAGKDLKTCFLYCSLFPEDFSIKIEELVLYWLAEGLIDDGEKYEDFYSRVISLIEKLKDACLLEDGSYEGTVKMHDVVRDVSIWIASNSSEDGSKSLVRSGNGLKVISATELSNSDLKRVSFMNNDLERLPDDESVIQCSEASTLLLQNNPRLDLIPERFLEGFEALRVLNISETGIKSLPVSLLQLDDLRALLLNNCTDLEELPPLERLSKLQVLDLSWTRIRLPPLERLSKLQVLDLSWTGIEELPRGLEQLSNLRHLILWGTKKLKAVQGGVISKLSSLEVLDMSDSNYFWKVKGAVNEEQAYIEELQCLKRLQFLGISLEWVPTPSQSYKSKIISLTNRLKGFQIAIVRPDHPAYIGPLCAPHAQRRVEMNRIDLPGGQIGWWLSIASDLQITNCRGLNEMLLINNSVGNLKKLVIYKPDSSFLTGGQAAQDDLLPNLEELCLLKMTGVESISKLVDYLGRRFKRLKNIYVNDCRGMKYLLSLGNSIRTMPNLEEIEVWNCSDLEELFNYHPLHEIDMAPHPILTPKLQKLILRNLPNLRNLCRDEKTWPGNKVKVDVMECDLLSTEQ